MKDRSWLALSLMVVLLSVSFLTFGEIKFTDITIESTTGDRGPGKGAAWGDVDNDGLLDLYVSNKGGVSKLFHNAGNGKFIDITDKAGLNNVGFSMGSVFGDINNDGWIDLYVPKGGRYEIEANRLFLNNGDGTFKDISQEAGVDCKVFTYGASMADYDHDGYLDIYCANYGDDNPNILYHNNGNLTFSNVSEKAGVADRSWSWSSTWCDVDNDGWDDLYVVNGRYPAGQPDKLFHNNHDGTFTDISKESGAADAAWGLGASFADVDNDGDFDLFVSNYVGLNKLFLNDGAGHFTDNSQAAGIQDRGLNKWGKGPTFGDIDNDGDLDLYEGDCKLGNQLYENIGRGVFKNITQTNPAVECGTVRTKATTFVDIDNDGDLDLYAIVWNLPNRLFKNEQNDNNWLQVELLGTESNRSAVGSKVRVYDHGHAEDPKFFRAIREVTTASGFCAMPGLITHFGLPADLTFDVVASFPSGRKVIQENIRPGRRIKIIEPSQVGWNLK